MQKVAAYCRVSTDKDDQASSLASQIRYFKDYINHNKDWELIEVYVDEGITGTSTKKRHSFNQMICDAMNHKFNLILTKEISRFARNTLDSIYYTRKLKDLGIGVIFINDNINTLDPDAELRLTIMSSIAQEESRKTSERVKWGQKRSMEQGVVFGRDLLGFDVIDGKLFINEDGAKIVRLIYHKFLNEGKGSYTIAKELMDEGIPSTYSNEWHHNVILRILRNEKYCGNLVQKKTYTPSFLSHKKKYNLGEEELVVIKDHHEAIISKEMFQKVQCELKRRGKTLEQKKKHSNRYCFSGKIKCGICGSSYVARTRKKRDGSTYKYWRCYEAVKHGKKQYEKNNQLFGCINPSIKEDDLEYVLKKLVGSLSIEKENIINYVLQIIKNSIREEFSEIKLDSVENKRKQLERKKQNLIELYLDGNINKDEFHVIKSKYEIELHELTNFKKQIALGSSIKKSKDNEKLMTEIETHMKGIVYGRIWCDFFYKNMIESITVYDSNLLVKLSYYPIDLMI